VQLQVNEKGETKSERKKVILGYWSRISANIQMFVVRNQHKKPEYVAFCFEQSSQLNRNITEMYKNVVPWAWFHE
jgi:hypothetical protein